MNCPICQHAESRTVRTDAVASGIKRRRECLRCRHRWGTLELPAEDVERLEQIRELARPLAEAVR